MSIRYDISAGYIGKNLNDIDYSVSGGGDLSIEYITAPSSTTTLSTYTFNNINLSSITEQDALVVLTQGEASGGGGRTISSITTSGITMTSVVQSDGSVGTNSGVVGIHIVNGSEIGKTSTESIVANFSGNMARMSIIVFRLVNGINAQILDTDSNQSINASTITNVVDFSDPSSVLFTSGYFPNGSGHTFTSGIENEYSGVQNSLGSGDGGINETPTTSSHTITYTHGGTTNDQGEYLVTAVLTPNVPLSQGLYSMNAVYNSHISDVYNTIVRPGDLDPIPVTDGLALHLDAADPNSYSGTGSTWFDISGNDRDFVWNSTPSFTSDTTQSYIDIDGNSAVGPDADTYGINDTNGFTIITLMRLDNQQAANYFLYFPKGTGVDDRGISIHLPYSDDRVYFDQGITNFSLTTQRLFYDYTSGFANIWKVFVFRREPSGARQVLEDNVVKDSDSSSSSLGLTSLPTYINRNYLNQLPGGHSGKVNSLIVYNRGITDTELTNVYNYLTDRLI